MIFFTFFKLYKRYQIVQRATYERVALFVWKFTDFLVTEINCLSDILFAGYYFFKLRNFEQKFVINCLCSSFKIWTGASRSKTKSGIRDIFKHFTTTTTC